MKYKIEHHFVEWEALKQTCEVFIQQFQDINDLLRNGYTASLELYVIREIHKKVSKKIASMQLKMQVEGSIKFDVIEIHTIHKALAPWRDESYFYNVYHSIEQKSLLLE